MKGNNFGWAIEQLKAGKLVCRSAWNSDGMFLYYVKTSMLKINRPPLLGIFKEGQKVKYLGHIDFKTQENTCGVWNGSQADDLATDWELAEQLNNE